MRPSTILYGLFAGSTRTSVPFSVKPVILNSGMNGTDESIAKQRRVTLRLSIRTNGIGLPSNTNSAPSASTTTLVAPTTGNTTRCDSLWSWFDM